MSKTTKPRAAHRRDRSRSAISSRSKWQKAGLLGMIVAFLAVQIFFTIQTSQLVWDEAAFLSNARDVYGASGYDEPFRPPLFSFAIANTWAVVGESVLVARILSVLAACASIALIYLLARLRTRFPLVIAALFALNAQVLFWSGFAYAEMLAVFLVLAGMWCYERGDRWVFASGICFSLAFLARFPLALISVIIAGFLLYRRSWKTLEFFVLGSSIPLIPWMISNSIFHANPLWDFLEYARIVGAYTTAQQILPYALLLLGQLLAFIIIIAGGKLNKRSKEGKDIPWILCLLVFVFIHLSIIRMKLPRYLLSFLPFIAIIAATRFDGLIGRIRPQVGKRTAAIAVITILMLAAIPPAIGGAIQRDWQVTCSEDDATLKAADELGKLIQEGTDFEGVSTWRKGEEVVVISNAWPHFGYLNDVRAWSLYTTNWSEIFQNVTPNYVVHAAKMGEPYDIEVLHALETPGREGTLRYAGEAKGSCDTFTLWQVSYRRPEQASTTTVRVRS